jgi:uncharacterized protein YbcI
VSVNEEPVAQSPHGGRLNTALANHVTRLFAEYTGRGPTRARTVRSGSFIAVYTQDLMTKAEKTLTGAGQVDLVVGLRRTFQSTMREDLVSGVEMLTGRRVVSFMSDHDAIHDCCVEVFILDQPVEDRTEDFSLSP